MAGVLTQSVVAIGADRFGSPNAYGFGCGPFQRGTDLYLVCSNPAYGQSGWSFDDVDGEPPPILAQAHVLKSQDNGATWFEVDTDNGPEVSLFKSPQITQFRGFTSPMAACYQDANTLLVAYWNWDYVYGNAPELRFSEFDLATDTWGAETAGGPLATIVEDQPQLNLSCAFRTTDGALIVLFDGYELVTGNNYSRMFYAIYDAGWSAAAPIDGAQTGTTDDYNMGGAVAGDAGRTHLFYRTLTAGATVNSLRQRTLTAVDVLIAAVTVTPDVDDGTFLVQPFRAPWGFPSSRSAAGVTTLFIPYIKTGVLDLWFAAAVSANSPTFAQQVIGGTNAHLAGIFNCGPLTASRGLAASTTLTGDPQVTGSQDDVTWEAFTPTPTPPVPSEGSIFIGNFVGLGITQGSGGYDSAGVIMNAFFFNPD